MEYLMTVALISIVVIPTAFLFYNYASDSAEEIDQAQIDKFGREVLSTAETVYYLGQPSRIVIEERLPANVEGIGILQDSSTGTYVLSIDVRTRSGIVNFTYPTQVNIAGSFGAEDVSEGIKNVRIESAPMIGDNAIVTINLGDNLTCNDGTAHNSCGVKPQLCYNGVLYDNCHVCGCPGTVSCKSDGSCLLPKISSIEPSIGLTDGGDTIFINGNYFIDDAGLVVKFDNVAVGITSASTTQIEVVNLFHAEGKVDVEVINSDGGSDTLEDGFTYTLPICDDLDGDGSDAVSALCPAGDDCDDGNADINPGADDICDGVNNDCDDGTADGSGEVAPACPMQLGVCAGSVKSCGGASDWLACTAASYGPDYEPTEVSCSDGLDNDCDGFVDEADAGCSMALVLAPDPVAPFGTVTATVTPSEAPFGAGGYVLNVCDYQGCDGSSCVGSVVSSSCTGVVVSGSSVACTFTAPSNPDNSPYGYYACLGENSDNAVVSVSALGHCAVADTHTDGDDTSPDSARYIHAFSDPVWDSYDCEQDNQLYTGCNCPEPGTSTLSRACDAYTCQGETGAVSCMVEGTWTVAGPWTCDAVVANQGINEQGNNGKCGYQYCGVVEPFSNPDNLYLCAKDNSVAAYTWKLRTSLSTSSETDCTDGYDNDCDNLVDMSDPDCIECADLDSDGFNAISVFCPGSNDCNDNPAANGALMYPGNPEVCDGLDNDCNPATADASGEAAPACPMQLGVCAGSVKSCGGVSGWLACTAANYGPNYESTEVSCSDGLDNDCNNLADVNDPNCVQCSDGADNDGDGNVDWPADAGCDSASDDDERNPIISSVVPASGGTTGGNTVVINGVGNGFVSGLSVTFDGRPATINSVTPAKITLTTPSAPAFNEFTYRRLVAIDNSGNANALTNYQVLVTMDTASLISAGKLRSGCQDIIFTDSDKVTELGYWLESGCNSANTLIWVNVPSIPASSTKNIYVYYGKPSASSASTETIWNFYDAFTVKDAAKWSWFDPWDAVDGAPWGIVGGVAVYPVPTPADWGGERLVNIMAPVSVSSGVGVAIETYVRNVGVQWAYDLQIQVNTGSVRSTVWGDWTDSLFSGSATEWSAASTRNWNPVKLTVKNGQQKIYINGVLERTESVSVTTVNDVRITAKGSSVWDWFRVRKFTEPEPTASLGAEGPAGTLGPVDVKVTNPDGESDTSPNGFTYV